MMAGLRKFGMWLDQSPRWECALASAVILGLGWVQWLIVRRTDFHGARSFDSPLSPLLPLSALGALLMSGWLAARPKVKVSQIIGLAGWTYLVAPFAWALGSSAHGPPGSYLFVAAPLLVYALSRPERLPRAGFWLGLPLAAMGYIQWMMLVSNTWLRTGWMTQVWSPAVQGIGLAIAAVIWAASDVRTSRIAGRKWLMPLAAFAMLGLLIAVRPPFSGARRALCPDVLRDLSERGSYLYSEAETRACKEISR